MSNSYRQILRSSSIIGGSSLINILLGLIRMKAVAILLGPSGVGMIGLLSNLTGLATQVAGLGMGNAGTRQIAEASSKDNGAEVATTRRVLFWATMFLALIGGGLFWLLRRPLAEHILGDAALSNKVGWLSLAVLLGVAGASQSALLTGLQRISDLAKASVLSAILSTIFGVGFLWLYGDSGIVIYIISVPLFGFLFGHWYVAKLPAIAKASVPFASLWNQWSLLVKLGVAFVYVGVITNLGHLAVRTIIQNKLGIDNLGFFQASFAISMTYIGFVLSAMGTDFYPRLTAAIGNHVNVNRMVNEQSEVALLLAGPIFIAMLALAPWVIEFLYSPEFYRAAEILHWQIIGDILKVASWPLGFIILASGDGRTFMLTESLAISVFILFTWIGVPMLGLEATGISFFGMYCIYFPIVYWLAKRRTGFSYQSNIITLLICLMISAILILVISRFSLIVAAVTGMIISLGFLIFGFIRLAHKTELTGWLGKLAIKAQKIIKAFGVWHE